MFKIFLFLLIFISCLEKQNLEWDIICDIYESRALPEKLSLDEFLIHNEDLVEQVRMNLKTEEVKNVFKKLGPVDILSRADLFAEGARKSLSKDWSCPSMKVYYKKAKNYYDM